jgi:YihY family inner membrane protein
VIKKYTDDRGRNLSALLAYYGFLALFPLLLVLTTMLGFVGNARLADSVVGTTLQQFPVIGTQIGKDAAHPLQGSLLALVVGLLGLLYGALGVTRAAQQAMAQVWNVPQLARPRFLERTWRGLLALVGAGVAVAVSTLLSGVSTVAGHSWVLRIGTTLLAAGWMVLVYLGAFRLLTPRKSTTREMLPGAVLGGVAYTALLTAGTALVQHRLRRAEALYGQFAFTLGLIGWLYLVAQLTVYAAEVNVVRHRRLWPRSLRSTSPTLADEEVLDELAEEERRTLGEDIEVGFGPSGAPGTGIRGSS